MVRLQLYGAAVAIHTCLGTKPQDQVRTIPLMNPIAKLSTVYYLSTGNASSRIQLTIVSNGSQQSQLTKRWPSESAAFTCTTAIPVCPNVQGSHGVGMQHIHCEANGELEATGDVEVDADGVAAEGRQVQHNPITNMHPHNGVAALPQNCAEVSESR